MFIHEDAGCRATTECFQSDGSGACEKIEHSRVFHALSEYGENRLPHEIRGWPRDCGRDFDGDAPGFSGDDSHGVLEFELHERPFLAEPEENLADVAEGFQIKRGALRCGERRE